MKIKNLEEMEEIVNSNHSLFWDGWSVMHKYKSDKARTSKYGRFINNQWCMVRKFEVGKEGWDIPERFITGYAQT